MEQRIRVVDSMKETEILRVDPEEAEEILIKYNPMPLASGETPIVSTFATNNTRAMEPKGYRNK